LLLSIILFFLFKVVFFVFMRQVEFDRIQSHDFERRVTLFAMKELAFVHVFVHMDFGFAFRASS
jgi:hypothetical protein